jgi:hypothetical protein
MHLVVLEGLHSGAVKQIVETLSEDLTSGLC